MDNIVKEILKTTPNATSYKSYDCNGNLLKQIELVDGKWLDVTERELEKIKLEKEILENKNLLKRFGNNDI